MSGLSLLKPIEFTRDASYLVGSATKQDIFYQQKWRYHAMTNKNYRFIVI